MTGGTNRRPWLPCALAAAAALMAGLVYLNALDNPFVYDDHRVILENYSIRDLSNLSALFLNDVFRPVVNISYALDYARSGLQPFGYHLTSLLLHMANVILLFVLARAFASDSDATRAARTAAAQAPAAEPRPDKKRKAPRPAAEAGPGPAVPSSANSKAFGAAALWAVHPLMTQAVGYVSGRSELLCALFMLAALILIRRWALGGRSLWLVAGLASWLLALGSKETAVMLPVLLLAYDRLIMSPADVQPRKRLVRLYMPLLLLVAAGGAVRLAVFAWMENAPRAGFDWANIPVGLDVIRRYVGLVFLAAPQSIFHTAVLPSSYLRPRVILDVLWMLTAAALAWRSYLRSPLVAFGAIWFAAMLLPSVVMLVIDVGEPMAEQRAYLAGCGFALSTGAVFGHLRKWPSGHKVPAKAIVTATLGLMLVVLAARTVARNEVWSDPVRLWREAAANAPDIWLPHRGLGDALRDSGDIEGAAAAYAEAARLNPGEANTHLALGISLLMLGRLEDADRALAEAARLSPGMAQAETARAMIARAQGRRDEARDRFLAVARAHPEAVLARQHLADMYENDYGDYANAARMCREVQSLAPQAEGVADCIRRNERRLAESGPAAEKR